MNMVISYLIQLTVTFIIVSLLVRYVRPHLHKVLLDLCGTEERAQFWIAFSNILLIGIPMIFALNYKPEFMDAESLFFDVAGKLSGNLGGMLVALIATGMIVSFFALVVPRTQKAETK